MVLLSPLWIVLEWHTLLDMKRAVILTFGLLFSVVAALGDTIAIFYALEQDVVAMQRVAGVEARVTTVGSRSIRRFQIGNHDIVAIRMGSGSVETAASAQAVLSRFRCDLALSIGPAGALSDNTILGSWYRISKVIAWQRGTTSTTGFLLAETSVWTLPDAPASFQPPEIATESVVLASGEVFVASEDARVSVRTLTGADLVDMNSFGLALVCKDHRVPLHIWRIASDRADAEASDMFRAFLTAYDGEGGRSLAEWIRGFPSGTNSVTAYPAIRRLMDLEP